MSQERLWDESVPGCTSGSESHRQSGSRTLSPVWHPHPHFIEPQEKATPGLHIQMYVGCWSPSMEPSSPYSIPLARMGETISAGCFSKYGRGSHQQGPLPLPIIPQPRQLPFFPLPGFQCQSTPHSRDESGTLWFLQAHAMVLKFTQTTETPSSFYPLNLIKETRVQSYSSEESSKDGRGVLTGLGEADHRCFPVLTLRVPAPGSVPQGTVGWTEAPWAFKLTGAAGLAGLSCHTPWFVDLAQAQPQCGI